MTLEEEIQELMEQKKQIEMRISELKFRSKRIGVAKIDQYNDALKYYYVAVRKTVTDDAVPIVNYRPQYNPIIVAKEKESAIELIPMVVEDLQKLYKCISSNK